MVVLTVVVTAYVVYLLRRPITWLVIAAFVAIAVSGPSRASRATCRAASRSPPSTRRADRVPAHPRRAPVPPLVGQGEDLVNNLPEYAADVTAVRQRQRHALEPERGLRHHRKLEDEARQASGKARRRHADAFRHRRGPHQLDLRLRDDPDPLDLHGLRWGAVDREVPGRSGARPQGAHGAGLRARSPARSAATSAARSFRRRSRVRSPSWCSRFSARRSPERLLLSLPSVT